jgi:spore coat polysaccharide biosynthesis protein SpsF (cytidylyltransferase family)
MATRMGDQQARSRNADRQNRLEVDTKKLLTLATELKEQVEKTDKNVLSIDVIKKADEIERLAKSVKERMKG